MIKNLSYLNSGYDINTIIIIFKLKIIKKFNFFNFK